MEIWVEKEYRYKYWMEIWVEKECAACVLYSIGIWCVVPIFPRVWHSCSGPVVLVILVVS